MFELLLTNKKAKVVSGDFGLFTKGNVVASRATDKYYLATNATSPGAVLNHEFSNNMTGFGNTEVGIFAGGTSPDGGIYTAATLRYQYSDEVASVGAYLSDRLSLSAATGTSVFGIISGGFNGTFVQASRKYTYAGNSMVPGSNMGGARGFLAACGNATLGIYAGGYAPAVQRTDRHVHASGSWTTTTNLPAARYSMAAIGTKTTAYFIGGPTTMQMNSSFTYSSSVSTYSTTASVPLSNPKGICNSEVGVCADAGTTESVSQKFTFANASWAPGSNLTYARSQLGSVSSNHGGLAL